MRLVTRLFGMGHGNFMPRDNDADGLLEKILRACNQEKCFPVRILAPLASYSNRVLSMADCNGCGNYFLRTKAPADGGLVVNPRDAVAFFTADCPIVCLWQETKLIVLHAGYRCIVPEGGERNILEAALDYFNPNQTNAWVGFGINSCCWLPEDDKTEIWHPASSRFGDFIQRSIGFTTAHCPFGAGRRTVNLYQVIYLMLLSLGLKQKAITLSPICTACARDASGQFQYWSHNRWRANKKTVRDPEKAVDGRNMVLAYLTE